MANPEMMLASCRSQEVFNSPKHLMNVDDKNTRELEALQNASAIKLEQLLNAQEKHNQDMRQLEEENKRLREKCDDMQESKEQLRHNIEALEMLRKQQ